MFKIVNQNLSHVLHVLQNMLEEMCITLNYSIYWCIHGNNVQFTLLLSNIHDSSPGKKKELLIFIFRDINFFLFKQKIILFFSFYFTNITFPCFIPRPLKFKKKNVFSLLHFHCILYNQQFIKWHDIIYNSFILLPSFWGCL